MIETVNDKLIIMQKQATVTYYRLILQPKPERPVRIIFSKLVSYSYKVYRLLLCWFSQLTWHSNRNVPPW